MEKLNMSWSEIKQTPRHELQMLLTGLSNYNILHSFDGYDSDDVSQLAKDKPKVRQDYNKYRAMQDRFGKKKKPVAFSDLVGGTK
tara:strand:+ start:5473 stop:5727 length:255 start_codon:yes stop_codon:yes gene_type:complete